jgi:anti-sigma regulatory factor (Ser/Thr protein kinase)
MYTDGLIERRGTPLNVGIDALASTVAGARTPEAACVLAVAELVPDEGLQDDAAIVALQNSEVPAELSLRLPAQPKTLAHVRRLLRRWLVDQGADEADVAEVTIAVSEACANAIEHAYSPAPATFELNASRDDGEVTVAIRDAGRWRAPRGSNRGRGLSIMVAAMDDVQIDRTDTGTQVVMRRRIQQK